MRSKSAEKRGRQKVVQPPTYRIENEYNPEAMPQYFQISVNILEGRKLAWGNRHSANSYVIVILGKTKHRTSIQRNMQEPYYRESFVFELYTSIRDLQQSSLWLAVMETRCYAPPRLVGETSIDLGEIWTQPHHQVFHKWAQLCLPRDPSAGPVGFLQVDVSIIFRGDTRVMPAIIKDDKLMEDNLLLPSGSQQQCANFLITIYGALGLPNGSQVQDDKRFGKPPSTFVRVSFCGLVATTATLPRNNNPMYCEKMSMVELFPNMSQFICLEVCSAEACFNRVLACAYLNLAQVSHDGENGFLPTFGPSLLHMYGTSFTGTLSLTGEHGPYHRGALLVALNIVVPFYQQAFRSITVEPVAPIKPEQLWIVEDFCLFCPIFEVSVLDRRIAGKLCGVAITMGEIPCESKGDEEFNDAMNELRARKKHYTGCLEVFKSQPVYGYLDFCNSFPVLQFGTRLPDFRFRMYRNNMVHGIVTDLNLAISEVKHRLENFEYSSPNELVEQLNKALDEASGNIVKFLDIVQYSTPSGICSGENDMRHTTELDLKQLALQKEEIEKIHQQISRKFKSSSTLNLIPSCGIGVGYKSTVTKKTVKYYLMETHNLAQKLTNLIYKNFNGWPDITVWLLNGGSRVAYTKISAADVIHSVIPEQSGKDSGRIQSVYMKPLKCPKHDNMLATDCHCIAGKVELLLWMGLYRQRSAFESCLPVGYHLKLKEYDMCIKSTAMMLECRAFIYKGKINSGFHGPESLQAFVRINALNSVKETKVKSKTLSPVWNQVLKINRMVFMTPERLAISPPIVLVEVNNTDLSSKTELIGRFQIQSTVDDRQDYESAPKLQWYDLYKGVECTGQVLMSVQLLQIPERELKTAMYGSVEECFASTSVPKVDAPDDFESLPTNLLAISSSYKVDIYWWGLRELNVAKKPGVILEIEEVLIKSEVIANKQSNCNFPNGRSSHIFEAPLNESYSPLLNIKLFDSSTFGRSLFLGSKVVKNPTKYLVNWLPKSERDVSLGRMSIMSSDFVQVNQMLFVKKSSHLPQESVDYGSNESIIKPNKCREKCKKWRTLFWRRELVEEECTLLPILTTKKQKIITRTPNDEEKDWWLKYLRSDKNYNDEENVPLGEKLIIYESELENQPEFSKFKDWCSSLKLYNGKKTGIPEKDEQLYCGTLKAGIAIYRWPPPANTVAVNYSGVDLHKGIFDDHPSNDPANFLIRVYLIKALYLKIKDYIGRLDAYVILNCGKKHLGDRCNYVSNTFNPIFGRMYEFRCSLPEDYLLTVSLFNYEESQTDELIGCTGIDLEDRIYTKHRARVGLSKEYNLMEKYKWRDCIKPSEILENLCLINHLPSPVFTDSSTTVMVNNVEYKDTERGKSSVSERKENLCLSILHKWHTLPLCGCHLVPEHVETRTLYNPDRPGTDHGKLHMWVDIFPLDTGAYIPPPIDITPRKVEDYELRLTIYSVQAFVLQADYPSRRISDFYVKAYLGIADEAQKTDVHYQCVTGESNFNWRMIFNFQYQPATRKLVRKEKGIFTEYEESVPPILIVQLMDNEAACPADCIGSLMLNLNAIPRGVKKIEDCSLDVLKNLKKINLFATRSLRAWWPLSTIDQSSGTSCLAGTIDLEITLLQQENATLMPVGIGREPPYPLPEPMRPEVSSRRFSCKLKNIYRISPRIVSVFAFCGFIFLTVFLALYFQLPAIIQYWIM
ncbi:fer-1-like protein 6 [Maniola jurtina]|uniref:fer-1-like protein 6 n=1 Tax=Maniola jurtina TaxID=191418 RepID=UPI001E6885B8|nr:fer-1-like protein 6 [Maniola jurtina]